MRVWIIFPLRRQNCSKVSSRSVIPFVTTNVYSHKNYSSKPSDTDDLKLSDRDTSSVSSALGPNYVQQNAHTRKLVKEIGSNHDTQQELSRVITKNCANSDGNLQTLNDKIEAEIEFREVYKNESLESGDKPLDQTTQQPEEDTSSSVKNWQTKLKTASGQIKSKYDSEYEQFLANFGSKWQSLVKSNPKLDYQSSSDKLQRLTLASIPNSHNGTPSAKSSQLVPLKTETVRLDSLINQYLKYQGQLGDQVKELWAKAISPKDQKTQVAEKHDALDKLLNIQASATETLANIQSQISKTDDISKSFKLHFDKIKASFDANHLGEIYSIQKLIDKLREVESEEVRVNKEAFSKRKEILRDKAHKKLHAGKYSLFKADHQIITPAAHFNELNQNNEQGWLLFEGEELTQEPVFEGNWTGLELVKDNLDSTTRLSKQELEGKIKRIIFSLKTSSEENFIANCVILSRLLRSNPTLRTVVIEENLIPFLLRHLDSSSCDRKKAALHETLTMCGHVRPPKGRGIRILAIDGGGIRGILSVLLLKRLQEECGGVPIPDMFDYVTGVSTGSILAAMAMIYDVPIDECENFYRVMSVDIFRKDILTRASKLIMDQTLYDSQFYSDLLKNEYGPLELSETSRDAEIPKISVVSSALNLPRITPYVFRNYQFPYNVSSKFPGTADARVWQALRASSAAPGIFEMFKHKEVLHQDGGVIVNNPTALAVHEAKLLWPNESIQCVVSLGTGRYLASDRQELNMSVKQKIVKLIDSATDTECVHTMMADFLPKGSYFRFNPYTTEDFQLDDSEPEKVDQLMWDGELYLRKNKAKLRSAAAKLLQPRSRAQLAVDQLRNAINKIR